MNITAGNPRENARPELLAPAGNMDSLLAALGSGADAVYLGLDAFNARSNADNFTLETLPGACAHAHACGAKIYLTVNVIILPHEMQDVVEMVEQAWDCGVDAIIVQDLGLVKVLSEVLPHIRLHMSTQMNIHSSESVRALARYGIKRVTLARETTLAEIATLAAVAAELGIEVESFVHGALCVCSSGQCLLSSLIGRRSANRGQCAQSCRLPYELVDTQDEELPSVGHHILSPKDLAGLEVLDELVATGVSSLKIEGRMKSPSYVAAVVSVYRDALDNGVPADTEKAYSNLAEAFSRGFTTAYLSGTRGNEMMSYSRPNNRGTAVGRITELDGANTVINFDTEVSSEDIIEIWTNKGRFAQAVGPLYVEGRLLKAVEAKTRATVALKEYAQVGDRVFRVRSTTLNTFAQSAQEKARAVTVPVDFAVTVKVGAPLTITVTDEAGVTGIAQGSAVEAARTKPISVQDIESHVNRLGGTLYESKGMDIELDESAGLGFSALHNVRRAALQDYETKKYFGGVSRAVGNPYLPPLPSRKKGKKGEGLGGKHVDIIAVTQSIGGAKAALNAGASQAHVAAYNLLDVAAIKGVVPVLPRISHDNEVDEYLGVAERFGEAVCSTLGQLKACVYRGIPAQAHWSFNVTNAYAANALAEMGATRVWLSPELSGNQIAGISRQSIAGTGIAVAGLSEVMVTEHCILMAQGPCNQKCAECKRREEPTALKDRKGYHFRVITDVTGRSHIYNSIPLDLTDAFVEIVEGGVSAVRIDLETALTSSVSHEVARVRAALMDTFAGREAPQVDEDLTRGHFFRGVL